MKRLMLIAGLLLAPLAAHANNCSGYTYTLTNGQTADANQVMNNFNNILNCADNSLAANGANSDITSLSALSTPLSVGQGGTGNTTGAPSGASGGVLSGTYPNPGFASIATHTFLANSTGGSAAPTAISATTATALLNAFTGDSGSGGVQGLVPAPSAGDAAAGKVLGAGGGWAAPPQMPSGSIIMYGVASAPTGWLICDGTAVSRTTYAALFAAIGTTFGAGNGTTTFNLPNMGGQFARGWVSGQTTDSGRTFGTTQADAFQGHKHDKPSSFAYLTNNQPGTGANGTTGGGNYNAENNTGTPVTDGSNGTPRTATETRPTNVALTYLIKI